MAEVYVHYNLPHIQYVITGLSRLSSEADMFR